MKKFIILLLTALMVNLSVNAQETTKKFGLLQKWSVGLAGGVQTNLHDWNAPQGAIIGVTVNKDINPYYGLTFEGTIGINNKRNWNVKVYNGAQAIDQVTWTLINRWNISNTFWGYNGKPRNFEVEALAGIGCLHEYGSMFWYYFPDGPWLGHPTHFADKRDAIIFKTGLNFNYNFGSKRNWTVTLQPTVIWDLTKRWWATPLTGYGMNYDIIDPEFDNRFNVKKAVFQVMGCITYHFDVTTSKYKMKYERSQEDVNALNNEINDLKAKNTELLNQLSSTTDSIHQIHVVNN